MKYFQYFFIDARNVFSLAPRGRSPSVLELLFVLNTIAISLSFCYIVMQKHDEDVNFFITEKSIFLVTIVRLSLSLSSLFLSPFLSYFLSLSQAILGDLTCLQVKTVLENA